MSFRFVGDAHENCARVFYSSDGITGGWVRNTRKIHPPTTFASKIVATIAARHCAVGGTLSYGAARLYGVIVTLVTFHRIAEPRNTTLGSLQPIS